MYIHIYGLHNRIEFVHLGKGLNDYMITRNTHKQHLILEIATLQLNNQQYRNTNVYQLISNIIVIYRRTNYSCMKLNQCQNSKAHATYIKHTICFIYLFFLYI